MRPRATDRTHRANWLRALAVSGQAPVFEIVEECSADDAYTREQFWIEFYRACECPLVNASDGGPGLKNPPPDVRAKKSAALMGHAVSEATRLAVSLAHKGKPLSEAHRVKISAAGKGRISEKRGITLTDEHRAKLSASLMGNQYRKGIPHDEQSKAKISAAGNGKPKSDEHRAKIGASQKGRKPTEEARAKMRMSAQKRWAKVKAENA